MPRADRAAKRARGLWTRLAASLWFIPGSIVIAAVILATVTIDLSTTVGDDALARWPRLFGAGADGARGMLTTIAGSVITVAGVTFSITIVALAQASTQYTPRVLRTFMADRSSQLVLGTFVGIFAYCLVVLRTIRGGDDEFVPAIATLVGFLLALLGVGVLIFFIHHIASILQVSTILERVRRVTEGAVEALHPDALDAHEDDDEDAARVRSATAGLDWQPVAAPRTGYLQSLDTDGVAELARGRGIVVRMERIIGEFVIAGDAVASFAHPHAGTPPDDEAGRAPAGPGALADCLTISAHRTVEQDAAFGITQIVDIALKALSTGVNDTTTALTCVDHLSAILACLSPRRVAPRARWDGGRLLLIPAGHGFAALLDLAIADIRRNAGGNVPVLGRILDALEAAARRTSNRGRRTALAAEVALTLAAIARTVPEPADRESLLRRAEAARRRIAGEPLTLAVAGASG